LIDSLEENDKITVSSVIDSSPTKKTGATDMGQLQYISDENNQVTGVIVPIDLWMEIQSEKETAYLLKSAAMKKRLLGAKSRKKGIPFDEACKKLGV
jgi:hypothetical protein